MSEVLHLENKRELFVDYYLTDDFNGTALKLHHPTPTNVAIKYDQPWETDDQGSGSFYTTVFQDGDIFRMYYRGHSTNVCYSESEDGINWNKPDLGIIEIEGSNKNNVIFKDVSNSAAFSPFIDLNPNILKSQKYKANMERVTSSINPSEKGINFYSSADGKQFKNFGKEPGIPLMVPNHFDSQNVIFWSEVEAQYVLYARYKVGLNGKLIDPDEYFNRYRNEKLKNSSSKLTAFNATSYPSYIRSIVRSTSPDFENWSEFVPMEYSDTDSITPSAQLYTNQTTPYFRANHIYISLPGRIFFGKIKNPKIVRDTFDIRDDEDFGDCSDGVLMTTRAGSNRYDFTFRESLLRPGIGDKNWTTRNNYPACGVIQTGETEMSIFVQRYYAQTSAYLERLTLRVDGFASLNAGYDEGQMVTKTLDFTGNKLELNYSTSAAGRISVEMLDELGTPIEGYGIDDCDGLIGDEISGYVSWNGSTDLSKISGRPVRVRFVMNDADIYSLRFKS